MSLYPSIAEVFQSGKGYNSEVGCNVRDWFAILRKTMPIPWKYDGHWCPCAHVFNLIDAATNYNLVIERLEERQPSAKHLIEQTKKGLDLHGLPRKGIVVHPFMWTSLERALTWPDAIRQDIESYLTMNAAFGAMDVEEMVQFERWVVAQGLRCSFSLDTITGGESVDARTAFESPL